ncbi:MAG: hypothetical protein ACREM2_01245 [Vulcanimicrobiaceae bacterium]
MIESPGRQPRAAAAFAVAIAASAAFLVLTVAAMLLYPGGRVGDPASSGYAFFANFFSDLGQTTTYGRHDNTASLVLFCIALAGVAFSTPLFFAAYAALFECASRSRRLALGAVVFSVATGVGFLGVAATPWNLYLRAHNGFVRLAFASFFVAALLAGFAAWGATDGRRRLAFGFAAFAVLLAVYLGMLFAGPPTSTPFGALVQATAQKIIVYAAILTVLFEAIAARRWLAARAR